MAQESRLGLVAYSRGTEPCPVRVAPDAYAAYGGVYVTVAILWLWLVDAVRPTTWDLVGVGVTLVGMGIIMSAPASAR